MVWKTARCSTQHSHSPSLWTTILGIPLMTQFRLCLQKNLVESFHSGMWKWKTHPIQNFHCYRGGGGRSLLYETNRWRNWRKHQGYISPLWTLLHMGPITVNINHYFGLISYECTSSSLPQSSLRPLSIHLFICWPLPFEPNNTPLRIKPEGIKPMGDKPSNEPQGSLSGLVMSRRLVNLFFFFWIWFCVFYICKYSYTIILISYLINVEKNQYSN